MVAGWPDAARTWQCPVTFASFLWWQCEMCGRGSRDQGAWHTAPMANFFEKALKDVSSFFSSLKGDAVKILGTEDAAELEGKIRSIASQEASKLIAEALSALAEHEGTQKSDAVTASAAGSQNQAGEPDEAPETVTPPPTYSA